VAAVAVTAKAATTTSAVNRSREPGPAVAKCAATTSAVAAVAAPPPPSSRRLPAFFLGGRDGKSIMILCQQTEIAENSG